MPHTILNGDCLTLLPTLTDNSVDLIITDPPYSGVKKEKWDRQWKTTDDYLAWLRLVLIQCQRVLKANGSLYLFASPQMSARVEILVGGRFQVLNNIRWRKEEGRGRHKAACKEELRAFFPASETIIFAEHYGADNAAKGEAGYVQRCDELRGFVFEPLRKYLDDERIKSGVSKKQIECATSTQMCSHWFTQSQWAMPTQKHYETMRALFNQSGGDLYLRREYEYLRREYEDLRREYEDLRRQYEDLRRPFKVTSDVPYTDVWDFPTVQFYKGKHPCEKPLPLIEHMIKASGKPGFTLLDPFCGSGAIGEAALKNGLSYIGMDTDQNWCNYTENRLQKVTK